MTAATAVAGNACAGIIDGRGAVTVQKSTDSRGTRAALAHIQFDTLFVVINR